MFSPCRTPFLDPDNEKRFKNNTYLIITINLRELSTSKIIKILG